MSTHRTSAPFRERRQLESKTESTRGLQTVGGIRLTERSGSHCVQSPATVQSGLVDFKGERRLRRISPGRLPSRRMVQVKARTDQLKNRRCSRNLVNEGWYAN